MFRPTAAVLLAGLALSGCAGTKPTPPKPTPAEEAREFARAARCHREPATCQEQTEREDLREEAERSP